MFETITPESIKENILNELEQVDVREGSYTNNLVSPTALAIWKLYDSLNALIPMVYVDETSGVYIDKKAANYGITRKSGTKASAVLHFTGVDGKVVPKGAVFLTGDGLEFVIESAVTLTAGAASTTAIAAEAGEAYNVLSGSITQQIVSISGLTGVTNEAAVGGTDPESDKSLVERLYAYLRKPATSGNVYHYEQWALAVDGVGGVKVAPLWNGPGTVKVLIVNPAKAPVDQEVVTRCADHIDQNRPIGATVTVESASALTINVEATITIESTTTKSAVKEAFANSLNAYLQSIAFEKYELIYNRLAFMLLDIEGVIDYADLTVNGGTSNITIAANEVPVAGMVVIS
ncbi:putative phage Mu protein gp47-like protein [Desulfitobacterium dehalogenans ATCC 51507]|uniref:Putative phage Mu protein gp47-like protein n=1 Tax=Desulfitobacterium dehalogenans (strain ATCC 51507 / DSM 9161 / JW/IU-DC1) TaxID=756499 RepID=I4AEK0_DESDJ|nr:baseplate J/gp47 family protein [Desulfitobacterium dehalogenans]AFM02385.1 putative phage Mu protein gp47-like protein [Desulfitobacterium dehalogenans ATCC 51507]